MTNMRTIPTIRGKEPSQGNYRNKDKHKTFNWALTPRAVTAVKSPLSLIKTPTIISVFAFVSLIAHDGPIAISFPDEMRHSKFAST